MDERTFFGLLLPAWFVLAGVVAVALLFVTAPYGRHARAGWGPALPARIGWMVMEAPAPLLFAACWAAGGAPVDQPALAYLALFELHYLHRAFVFPLRLAPGAGPVPLSVMGMALVFNLGNAYLQGRWLFHFATPDPPAWLASAPFLAGLLLFGAGFAINLHADGVLRRLRRGGEGYRIPQGGLFRRVSCPNYLGEIMEWCGWALATFSWAGLAFAVWTAANLVPRALAHHRWYREQFPEYPQERKALVPWVL